MKFIKYTNLDVDPSNISVCAKNLNLNDKLVEILFNRGYKTEQEIYNFLHPELFIPQSPYDLDGVSEAVEIIQNAIENKKRILIFGDYDVDGISATTVMIKTLRILGAKPNYFLPNRYTDGYGLTIDVLKKILPKYNPDLIITVDCGITAVDEVEFLKQNGIEVIITDHHELGEILPRTCIINCKKPDQRYKFSGLCGTGVAYKLAEALTDFDTVKDLLPIVAVATIADIVPLKDENRHIVYQGLKNLDKLPSGIKTLFKDNKLNLKTVTATDIAFKIAPKLNASGRMGDANDSLNLYLENNPKKIKELIEKINNHNTKRQDLCSKVYDDAVKMLDSVNLSAVPAIILYNKEWDSGILGIVCSKLLERYNRPVFLFSEEDGVMKGSARSIQDINIHNILTAVKDLLVVFGGHTMAAGLTLKSENFIEFRNRVFSYIFENIDNKVFVPVEYYDAEISLSDLTPKFISDMKLIEPCGCDNFNPKFMIKSKQITLSPLKRFPNHAYIEIDKKLSLIYFNYLQDTNKLNFGRDYYFIFDLQDIQGKVYKGMVKNFDCSYDLDNKAKKYLEPLVINQFTSSNNDNAKYKTYNEHDLLNFVLDLTSSAFGTLFVASTIQSYINFIEKYDTKNIYEFNIIEGKISGFNSIILAPLDINVFKNYKRIIFLDNVISTNYIININKLTNAEIFLPNIKTVSMKMLSSLNTKRETLLYYFGLIKSFNGMKFNSILSMYSFICKSKKIKINFADFIFAVFVFQDLKLLCFQKQDLGIVPSINNSKTNLNESTIYNNVLLLNKITQ